MEDGRIVKQGAPTQLLTIHNLTERASESCMQKKTYDGVRAGLQNPLICVCARHGRCLYGESPEW